MQDSLPSVNFKRNNLQAKECSSVQPLLILYIINVLQPSTSKIYNTVDNTTMHSVLSV